MEDTNGSVKTSQKGLNGINGHYLANGHATSPRGRTTPKQRRGLFSWTFSLIARLLTWYSILSILFRCPATLDECSDSSPRVCKPYFQLKNAVTPHLEPYYDAYAAPYVELARPYYETVDNKVLTPTWSYATKYGAPRVAQAQAFGQDQWTKNVQPELTKYQALAKVKYDETLAPHVDRASAAVAPYYDVARTNTLRTYNDVLLPSYVVVEPYVQQGYQSASTFTTETAVPSVAWAWNKTYFFLDGTVLPQLRFLYIENVEPQLQKIGQRLGRYNGSNTHKTAEAYSSTAAKAASTLTKPTSLVSSASATPAVSSALTSSSEPSASDAAPPSSEEPPVPTESAKDKIGGDEVPAPEVVADESDSRRVTRETVAEDLKAWQEKYSKAAEEGAVEIEGRIDEISKRMIEHQAQTTGKSLVKQLKETIDTELTTLKGDIRNIISQVIGGSESSESAQEQFTAAIRAAGFEIKEKSRQVRIWREDYEKETQATVTKVAEDHFRILDSIRDLALQKIGMKWAWMDGVTYKDWAKYHLLKERFDEYQVDLKNLITNHPGLDAAQNEGHAVEGQAMELAQSAAKELVSLKQVAAWKLIAQDDSDEFDPEVTRLAAEEAEKAATEAAASEAEASSESATEDSTSIESDTSTSSADEETTSTAAPDTESAEAVDTPDLASSVVLEETPVFIGDTQDATEAAEPGTAHVPVDEVAEPVEADISPVDEPEASPSSTLVKSVFLGAVAQSVPTRQPILDYDDTFEAAENAISAMQSDIPATISSAASSAYSAAMAGAADRYSQALSLVSAQVSGTPKPMHEQMLASVTSAYGNAVAAASSQLDAALGAAQHGLWATTTTNALPTMPTLVEWANVESIAAQRLNEGRSWAEQQYESAKVAIGLATPTPTDFAGSASSAASAAGESLSAATAAAGENVEKLLHNAQYNYYAGLGVAQVRYSEFLAAASSAFSSLTATPTPTDFAGTVSSVAAAASESAALAAAAVEENANAAAAAGYENVAAGYDSAAAAAAAGYENIAAGYDHAAAAAGSAAAAGYDNIAAGYDNAAAAAGSAAAAGYDNIAAGYDNAAAAAGSAGTYALESWNAVLEQISNQVYGAPTPTPWFESVCSVAGDYAASATEAVGGGAGTITSAAGSYATAASDEASKQYIVVSSIVSELLVGKEPTFSESVYSRLAGAYAGAADSVNSFASVASETLESVATEASEEVRKATQNVKDEL